MNDLMIANAIQSWLRILDEQPFTQDDFMEDFSPLYMEFENGDLIMLFSKMHSVINKEYQSMNKRLPTMDEESYFWAEDSRKLLGIFEILDEMKDNLADTVYAFHLDDYYDSVIQSSKEFLQQWNGSTIPIGMDKVTIYYAVPIFIKDKEYSKPMIKELEIYSTDYIKNMYQRMTASLENKEYDNAVTKARTLLEDIFKTAIQDNGQNPKNTDIVELFKQYRKIYNMSTDKGVDDRLKHLVSGLITIVNAIAELRNSYSDAHGQGRTRYNIKEHHARLAVNASITIAEFFINVEHNNLKVT